MFGHISICHAQRFETSVNSESRRIRKFDDTEVDFIGMIVMGESETFATFVCTYKIKNILPVDSPVRMREVTANIVPPQLPPLHSPNLLQKIAPFHTGLLNFLPVGSLEVELSIASGLNRARIRAGLLLSRTGRDWTQLGVAAAGVEVDSHGVVWCD